MALFLNAMLFVVLALSVALFVSMFKVGKETIASLPTYDARNVGEKQLAGMHVRWTQMSLVLICLVLAGFVLVNF